MIDVRMSSGTKAATMITVGKNETNALAASATLRSTNSISSMRSQTRQSSSRSSQARTAPIRVRNLRGAVRGGGHGCAEAVHRSARRVPSSPGGVQAGEAQRHSDRSSGTAVDCRHAERMNVMRNHVICVMRAEGEGVHHRSRRAAVSDHGRHVGSTGTGQRSAALDYTDVLRLLAINDARFGEECAATGRVRARRARSEDAGARPACRVGLGRRLGALLRSRGRCRGQRRCHGGGDRRRARRCRARRRSPVRRGRGSEARHGARVRRRRRVGAAVAVAASIRRADPPPSPVAPRRFVTRRPAFDRSIRPRS